MRKQNKPFLPGYWPFDPLTFEIEGILRHMMQERRPTEPVLIFNVQIAWRPTEDVYPDPAHRPSAAPFLLVMTGPAGFIYHENARWYLYPITMHLDHEDPLQAVSGSLTFDVWGA